MFPSESCNSKYDKDLYPLLGGTMVAAIDLVKERGIGNKHIRVVSISNLKSAPIIFTSS